MRAPAKIIAAHVSLAAHRKDFQLSILPSVSPHISAEASLWFMGRAEMSSKLLDRSERNIVQGLLSGDRSAWKVFTQRYDTEIYTAIDHILRRCPRYRTRVDREEIYANFFVKLLSRDMHRLRVFDFERGIPLGSWLRVLAMNAARDYVRTAVRREAIVRHCPALQELADTPWSGPLWGLLYKEAIARARGELEQLPERDRQLIDLLLVQEQEPEQVAMSMNISIDSVYAKKSKLIRRFERSLRVTRGQRRTIHHDDVIGTASIP